MQRLEVSGAVRPLYWSLDAKGLRMREVSPPLLQTSSWRAQGKHLPLVYLEGFRFGYQLGH